MLLERSEADESGSGWTDSEAFTAAALADSRGGGDRAVPVLARADELPNDDEDEVAVREKEELEEEEEKE
jgi:hypothetical protein